jgi:hypothetical protein
VDQDEADDEASARARQRALVRRGYDAVSQAYRDDDGRAAGAQNTDTSRYAGWVAELAGRLRAGARVLDLGCGAGIPATRELADRGQRALFGRIRDWLRPDGLFLAIVGAQPWTGTEQFHGAEMFWDHAGTESYLGWLEQARLTPLWHRFVPESERAGHSLILARAC